jgi:HSP20 family protein
MLIRRFGWPWATSRELNRLSGGWPTSYGWRAAPSYPAMNVWTNEDGGIVTAELPGVDPGDIEISVRDDTLTLRGSRKAVELEEGTTYHRRERGSGAFARTVELPFRVEGGKVEATFEKGVLKISLPRAEEDKPKKITIKTG